MSSTRWCLKRLKSNKELYPLSAGNTVIGRLPNATITLSKSYISKKHCRIIITNDESKVFIEDMSSGNGTYLGSERLVPDTLIEINKGAVFSIGLPVNENLDPSCIYFFELIDNMDNNVVVPIGCLDNQNPKNEAKELSIIESIKENKPQNTVRKTIFIDSIEQKPDRKSIRRKSKTEGKVVNHDNNDGSLKRTSCTPKRISAENTQQTTDDENIKLSNKSKPIVKITLKNRGSFLIDEGINNRIDNEKVYDTNVSENDASVLSEILSWKPESLKNSQDKIALTKKYFSSTLPEYFNNIDDYKRNYLDMLHLDVWNAVKRASKSKYYEYKMLHTVNNVNITKLIMIHIRPIHFVKMSNELMFKYGDIIIVKTVSNQSYLAVIQNANVNVNCSGVTYLRACVKISNVSVNFKINDKLHISKICNISLQLNLISELGKFNQEKILSEFVLRPDNNLRNMLNIKNLVKPNNYLNDEQLQILQNCLAHLCQAEKSVQIINGSPGTGKTTLICHAVDEYVKSRKYNTKILICAPSERSIENLLQKFIKLPNFCHNLNIISLIEPENPCLKKYFKDDKLNKSLMSASIVFATAALCSKLQILQNKINWCVIDDASMLYEPEIISALNLNIEHLTLIGNVEHTVHSSYLNNLPSAYKNRSMFHRLFEQMPKYTLKVQHRINPMIPGISGNLPPLLILKNSEDKGDDVDSICVVRIASAICSINADITVLTTDVDRLSKLTELFSKLNFAGRDRVNFSTIINFIGCEDDVVVVAIYGNVQINKELFEIALSRAKRHVIVYLGACTHNMEFLNIFIDKFKGSDVVRCVSDDNDEKLKSLIFGADA